MASCIEKKRVNAGRIGSSRQLRALDRKPTTIHSRKIPDFRFVFLLNQFTQSFFWCLHAGKLSMPCRETSGSGCYKGSPVLFGFKKNKQRQNHNFIKQKINGILGVDLSKGHAQVVLCGASTRVFQQGREHGKTAGHPPGRRPGGTWPRASSRRGSSVSKRHAPSVHQLLAPYESAPVNPVY